MRIKNRQSSEHYRWGEICDGWRLLGRPDLSVIQERIPQGGAEVRHVHQRARQLFFVLGGQLHIELGDDVFALEPGDSLEVQPGQSHRVQNNSDADVSFLVVSAPSTQGDRQDLPRPGE